MTNSMNTVKIDLSAIEENLGQVRKLIRPETRIMGIVKSDAYGHGLVQVSRTLERNGVDFLGVSFLHEAMELRENGIRLPIAILCGMDSAEDAGIVLEKDLTPVIFDTGFAEILSKEAERRGKRADIHIKIDTGMGRLGFHHEDTGKVLKRIMEYPFLNIGGLMSHFSSADEPDSEFTDLQTARFRKAIDISREIGLNLTLNHLANSAGIMSHRDSHFDMVRPGIMLYGGLPSPDYPAPVHLKPVMEFKARVLQIRDFCGDMPVSYGRRYYTNGNKKIAVISCGYADGIPRSLSNKGEVLIGGRRNRIAGTVCMNITECDITGLAGIKPGDECVIIGTQKGESITGDDMAAAAGTISYELFLSIGGNIREKRVNISGKR